MADFKKAYPKVQKNEGGYSNDPNDNGGYTYCGITEKNFPEWAGWNAVHAANLKTGQFLHEIDALVEQFYKHNFWDKIRGDEIINQESANDLFDFSVNAGVRAAIREKQKSLGITQTNIMDETTLNRINLK